MIEVVNWAATPIRPDSRSDAISASVGESSNPTWPPLELLLELVDDDEDSELSLLADDDSLLWELTLLGLDDEDDWLDAEDGELELLCDEDELLLL